VFKLGIFEGLLIAMAIHAAVHYLVYTQVDKLPLKTIWGNYVGTLKKANEPSTPHH
jgi:hypothetical protein